MGEGNIRVLVVDDSATFRHLVSSALEGGPGIEVVGTAPNGSIALQKIERLRPDVVTLDIEMPEMDGLETLSAMGKRFPDIRAIMVSALTERGAAVTIEALSRGAFDFIAKPTGTGSLEKSREVLREDLRAKVRSVSPRKVAAASPAPAPPRKRSATSLLTRRDVLLIGVSTGGPNALAQLIPALPGDLPVGVLIVQHMPPMFTAQLAKRLDSLSALKVREARGGEVVRPGEALIAPGGRHMVLEAREGERRTRLSDEPPENNCRPAVDPLFRSAAALYGENTLAVILTGMGQDGFAGAQLLKDKGAYLIAQDEASCVVYGMPRFVVEAGLADRVLPLGAIAGEIESILTGPFSRRRASR